MYKLNFRQWIDRGDNAATPVFRNGHDQKSNDQNKLVAAGSHVRC